MSIFVLLQWISVMINEEGQNRRGVTERDQIVTTVADFERIRFSKATER